MRNYLTAYLAWAALMAACPGVLAQPAAAPTQPATPNVSGASTPGAATPAGATQATPQTGTSTPATGGAPASETEEAAPAEPAVSPGLVAPTAQPAQAAPAPAALQSSPPDPTTDSSTLSTAASPRAAGDEESSRSRRRAPAEYPLAVYLNVEPQWNTDPGYDLFDDDDVGTEIGLGVSYDVVDLAPKVALVGELAWGMSAQEQGSLFGGVITDTEIETHRFSAAVSAHYRILPWLGPHARLAAGLLWFDAKLDGMQSGERFEDSVLSPFVRLGGGISAEQAVARRIAVGALVEGGYTLAKGAALELEPKNGNGGVSTDYAALGTLSLSGPYLRVAGLVRF